MKWILHLFVIFALFLHFSSKLSFAKSEYVLPYPSSMPGSKFYPINLTWDRIIKYWYFGDFGQLKYNLKQADKYLVEAKTLFEYKQYSLAIKALENSDRYFYNISTFLRTAKLNHKNIDQQQMIFKNASLKHIEVLEKIKWDLPEEFIWQPEKESPKRLQLWEILEKSKKIRSRFYE